MLRIVFYLLDKTKSKENIETDARGKFNNYNNYQGLGRTMPHDNIQLAQAPNGEIGPRCKQCGVRMTFGAAMVINNNYYCWECYVEVTGADSSTKIVEAEKKFWMTNE